MFKIYFFLNRDVFSFLLPNDIRSEGSIAIVNKLNTDIYGFRFCHSCILKKSVLEFVYLRF